ncbi:hypothetical protein E4T56_gene3609 [Termitomyces sp. T112]|nr:hypothetical protein E4T56_gene3609 [Termitomyces sp. T112]
MPEPHQACPPSPQLIFYSSGPPWTYLDQFPLAILTGPQCLEHLQVPGSEPPWSAEPDTLEELGLLGEWYRGLGMGHDITPPSALRPSREEAPVVQDKGKQRVSLPPEAGPSKRPWGEASMASSPGPHLSSLILGTLIGGSAMDLPLCQRIEQLVVWERELQRAEVDQDTAWEKRDMSWWNCNSAMQMAMKRALKMQGLQECLMQLEAWSAGEVEGWQGVLEDGVSQVEVEAGRQ